MLSHYAEHAYKHFEDTSIFINIVRNWFNQLNVKSADYGMRSQDERRNPIRRETVEQDLPYIADFCSSLEMWQTESESIRKLSLPTVTAIVHAKE